RDCFCSGARVQVRDRLPKGVTLATAGRALVHRDELRWKLGLPAFQAWTVMCLLRAPDGVVHPTARGIGAFPGFRRYSARTIEKAIRRLYAAKLVERVGWQLNTVMRKTRTIQRKVYVRKTYGAILHDTTAAKDQCIVPQACADWLLRATTHGGSRAGAGRKRSGAMIDLLQRRRRKVPGSPAVTESSGVDVFSSGVDPHPPGRNQGAEPISNTYLGSKTTGGSLPTE